MSNLVKINQWFEGNIRRIQDNCPSVKMNEQLCDAMQVVRLPKTRSGKILRGTMRSIANNKDYKMPSTIDDPAILDEITGYLTEMGYVKK